MLGWMMHKLESRLPGININNLKYADDTTLMAESEVAQSWLTFCDSMDCSLPASSIHGIFQARVLEWVAISFSNAWKWKVKVKLLSRARLLVTPCTAAYQAPPSMEFARQEYWSGVPLPSPRLYWAPLIYQSPNWTLPEYISSWTLNSFWVDINGTCFDLQRLLLLYSSDRS